MVLFYMPHLMNLYQFLTFKFTRYEECEVVLLTHEAFAQSETARKLMDQQIFVKVIGCEEIVHDDRLFEVTGSRDWQEGISAYFDKIFFENELSIMNFADILVSCDVNHNFFLYCCFREKKVSFVELHKNQFDHRHRYEVNGKCGNGSMELERLNLQYAALTGENENVIKRYRFGEENRIVNGTDEFMNFLGDFYGLSTNIRDKIKSVFGINNMPWPENCSILLLNSIGYSIPKTKLRGRYHYLPYLLMADFYMGAEDKVFFKDHPMTTAANFGEDTLKTIVGEEKQLVSITPIEFYALADDFHIRKLISANSTGNFKVSQFVEEEIVLGDSYLIHFRLVHRLFVSFSIDNYIGESKSYHYYGISREFMIRFKKYVFTPFGEGQPKGINTSILKGRIFTIIDQIPDSETKHIETALLNADPDTKVVFIDSDETHNFLTFQHTELLKYIIPIRIQKRKLREDTLSDTKDERIWFFCKNDKIREKVCDFSVQKKLEYAGIEILVTPVDGQFMKSTLLELRLEFSERQIKKQQEMLKESVKFRDKMRKFLSVLEQEILNLRSDL